VYQLAVLAKDREDIFLVVLLVVLLHEGADKARGMLEHGGRDLLAALDTPYSLLVDEQARVQDAMLFHQVFGSGDARIGIKLALRHRQHGRAEQQSRACRQCAAAAYFALMIHESSPPCRGTSLPPAPRPPVRVSAGGRGSAPRGPAAWRDSISAPCPRRPAARIPGNRPPPSRAA